MSTPGSKQFATATRRDELKAILENRRAELLRDLQHRIRGARTDAVTCEDCGGDISGRRLRALPFARRCKDCEEAREGVMLRERAQRTPALLLERR